MAIRAYDESYLSGAQNILGHAVDFAVMTLAIEPNDFGNALAVSESAKQFSEGNPRYVAGMNGCEFARAVLDTEALISCLIPLDDNRCKTFANLANSIIITFD